MAVSNDNAKPVFEASAVFSDDEELRRVVVKFAPEYCYEAHKHLAEMGRAPELLYFGVVKGMGGTRVVVMNFVAERQPPTFRETDHTFLHDSIKALHDKGWVFGRVQEILRSN